MLSTCFAGSEPISCLRVGYCRLISLAAYTLVPLPPGYAYQGAKPENSNYCECSTVGYSLISACVTCQERTPLRCDHMSSPLLTQIPGVNGPGSVHALAGLNIRRTVYQRHLLRCEFPEAGGLRN